jgi:hypothetical protein
MVQNSLRAFERVIAMVRILPKKSVLLIMVASLLLAGSVLAQENQSAPKAEDATTLDQSATTSTAPLTNPEQNQNKQLAAVAHEVVAEKEKPKEKELKSASKTTANDVEQEPAAPAGGEDAAELSKKLANPVSSLISFPIQTNFDFGMGTGSGWKMTMNIQPVIPVALNKEWNLISRTIIPIIHQGNVVAAGTSQNGLGDIVQSIFISPNKTEPFIWGVGPVVLVPSATNQFLGGKQLGLGPTVVMLKQRKGWTVGALWNHIWRVAGGSGRRRVNADFIQPFLSYSTRDGWSYTLNTESTYDWTGNHWAVPIHFQIAKIVRFGKQPVSFGGAMRCWATSPSGGAEGCGLRIVVTGIFPKK